MSQAAPSKATPAAGRMMVAVRAIVFVALLTGNLFPPIGGTSLATAAALLAAPLIVYELFRYLPRIHPALPVCLVIFGVLLLPGIMDPPFTPYGEEKFGKIVTSLLLSAMAVVLLRDRRHLRALAWVWLIAAAILALAAIFGATGSGTRAIGFGSNPIWLGRELTSGLIVALWLIWQRRLHAIPGLVAIGLVVTALVSTESRGPLLAAVVALAIFAVIAAPGVTQLGVAMLAFAAAGAIGFVHFFPDRIPERVLETLLSPGGAMESSQRTDIWADTLPLIADNPWGVGYGNWSQESGVFDLTWPHNLFFEVFAEAGWIPGAVIAGATVWVIVRLAKRSGRDPYAVLLLMMFAASTVEVSASGDINARTFFALLILGYVATRWPNEPRPEPAEIPVTRPQGRVRAASLSAR